MHCQCCWLGQLLRTSNRASSVKTKKNKGKLQNKPTCPVLYRVKVVLKDTLNSNESFSITYV